ncbi:MAG: coproporphyrinogen III oxidase family protein [Bacteroidales bacterium]|jgi:coproporphyrinogen III oxidase-like Fe-S oxidoreductase|nr:coproporphyrinogen III oxidase family protein [Bacteroidales bacterium]MCI1732921.1 coproporphyrinogen III oxidase family protein [Bacteroidales bacterium]
MAGIYVHIPFCNSFCIYCGFYSVINKQIRESYIPALKREISGRRNFFDAGTEQNANSNFSEAGAKISTLYFGGGTPSVLQIPKLEEIVRCLKENFQFAAQVKLPAGGADKFAAEGEGKFVAGREGKFEFTVEVNPDDITPEYAAGLKSIGVNRISMGVQSFIDEHLKWMHRRHTSADAINAYHILRDAGFDNISLDLIFGFAGLTTQQWRYNLIKITSLRPDHISAYQLSIDEGTTLEALANHGKYEPLSADECAAQYAMLQDILSAAGYDQYEISNFARRVPASSFSQSQSCCNSPFQSQHNSNYWNKTPYLGLGPGAHSFDGHNQREWNFPNVINYCNPQTKEIRSGETLTEKDIFNESIMLGLRQINGLDLSTLNKDLLKIILPVIARLEDEHLLLQENLKDDSGREKFIIKIPTDKFFISDSIMRDLFV